MKKILFVIPSYKLGGTNTSLLNLVRKIDRSQYQLFVYAINKDGPLGDEIHIYCDSYGISNISIDNYTHSGEKGGVNIFLSIAKKVFWHFKSVRIDLSSFYYKRIAKAISSYGFDCVIAFQEGNATELVSYCRNCKTVAWVRSDYRRYLKNANKKPEYRIYSRFSLIVNVSQTAMKNFNSVMPQFESKSIFIYNLLDKERVLRLSKESCDCNNNDVFTIVSIGRVDPVKHFTEIPGLVDYILKKGLTVRWLIVGGKQPSCPEEYESIERIIAEQNLQNNVIMLGQKRNPYCYLKNSNLLVCLSESETFNHTFFEARTIGIPVVSVNYDSAAEMLQPNTGGLIVPREKVGETICWLYSDKASYDLLRSQAESFAYDNESILARVYEEVF